MVGGDRTFHSIKDLSRKIQSWEFYGGVTRKTLKMSSDDRKTIPVVKWGGVPGGLLVEETLPMGEFRWEEERALLVLLGKTGR